MGKRLIKKMSGERDGVRKSLSEEETEWEGYCARKRLHKEETEWEPEWGPD